MLSFWDSVFDLRRIELVMLILTMTVPVVCGTVLFTVRQRIKNLQDRASESLGLSHAATVHKLQGKTERLESYLGNTRQDLSTLRRKTAPREISDDQARLLQENLRGVKASPVIVAAYSFEEESQHYAAQLAAVLRSAGWVVSTSKGSMNDFKGISLGEVNLMRRPLTGLKELARAFQAAGLDVHQRDILPESIAGRLEDGALLVVVGRK